jgi:hypothetical protein
MSEELGVRSGEWGVGSGEWGVGFSIRFATRSDGGSMCQLDNELICQCGDEAMRQ